MLEHILDLLLGFCQLEWTQFVQGPVHWGRVVFELNLELVPLVYRWKPGWQLLWENIIVVMENCLDLSRQVLSPQMDCTQVRLPLVLLGHILLLDHPNKPQKSTIHLLSLQQTTHLSCRYLIDVMN